ncbi:MAG: dihydropteroate synthase [Acetobacteraceae bacterium]
MPSPVATTARSWAGLVLDRPRVMGILNLTPDSFSDGGRHATPAEAIAAAHAMAEAGADIIDLGGESTRPGAAPVPAAEQLARVLPVLAPLARAGLCLSIDTADSAVMRAALDAGARIINDVSALARDPASGAVVAAAGAAVVLMHSRGTPATMAGLARYASVGAEVAAELAARIAAARAAGIAAEAICLDPGFGFAKRAEHSLALLRDLSPLTALGYPLLVGVSRKSFLGRIAGVADPAARDPASLAAALWALDQGAAILRVHNVSATVQAIHIHRALRG